MYSVQLYCYDLSGGMAANLSPMLLGRRMEGIWHTSIVVYGKEFYFDGGTGIVHELPGQTRFGRTQRIEQLGLTSKTEDTFTSWTREQRNRGFGPNDYSLLTRNCNHFTQVAAQFLLQRDIPSDIRDMIPMVLETPMGRMIRPMLEQMTSATNAAESSAHHPSAGVSSDVPVLSTTPTTTPSCTGLLSTKEAFTEGEEEDILIARAIMESSDYLSSGTREGFTLSMGALELLRSIFVNILEHPSEVKFRGISTSSKAYTEKLLPLEKNVVIPIFRLAGFRLRTHTSGSGHQWFLSDADGSADILSILVAHVNDMIDVVKAAEPVEPPPVRAPPPDAHKILQYFALPAPEGFKPLPIGYEYGNRMFACRVTVKDTFFLGKCALDIDSNHVAATYCDFKDKEVCVQEYTVLCVRDGCEGELTWISAYDAFNDTRMTPEIAKKAIFCVEGEYSIIRAPIGNAVHAGFADLSGRCVVPYGGHAKECSSSAEILCLQAHVPPSLITEYLEKEEAESLITSFKRSAGIPVSSLKDLLSWSATEGGDISPAVECRKRVKEISPEGPRLMVCHDMRGGYLPGDYPYFALALNSEKEGIVEVDKVVDLTYTVSYWPLIDYFIYFSHAFISVPPKEWINAAHQNGVPALGTFITEGSTLDLSTLVMSPENMGKVIKKLSALCDTHNFDGYLINIESRLDKLLAQRLVMFVNMLRQTLNGKRKPDSTKRYVIWYDAITIDGRLNYQNGLTEKNKPFFDVSDGIFTNYFWNPMSVELSKTLGANRASEVYIGVDVFGRNMYGGGGYASDKAVKVAKECDLSVALFAPGWTCEIEGKGDREEFLRAESNLWSKLQEFYQRSCIEFDQPLLWTSFRSGVGKQYYVNGEEVVAPEKGTEWCQLSHAHLEPDFRYCENVIDNAPLEIAMPFQWGEFSSTDTASGMWMPKNVWMGDRSLRVILPMVSAVRLVNWRFKLDAPSSGSSNSDGLAAIDIAWLCDSSKRSITPRQLCVGGISAESPNEPTQMMFDESNPQDGLVRVVLRHGTWEIVRYIIPARVRWSYVTSIAVQNGSRVNCVSWTVGAIGITKQCMDGPSILAASPQCRICDDAFKVRPTKRSNIKLIYINLSSEHLGNDVLLFVTVLVNDTPSVIYVGQHVVAPSIVVPIHLPNGAVVKELFMYRVATGN